jgi:hypothetical protein
MIDATADAQRIAIRQEEMMATKKQPAEESEGLAPEDIAIWDVDEDLKSYRREPELRRSVEGQYTGIIKFMSDNGLFKKKRPAVDAGGKLLIRQVYDRDLTDLGQAFVRLAIKPWFRSKTSAQDPGNTRLLEKYLRQLKEK